MANRLWLGLVLAGCAVAIASAGLPFIHSDGPLFAQVAKNVVATGDWITLRHAAYAEVDKPPLTIWLTAASIRVAGDTPVALRTWHIVITLALVWATYRLARRGAEQSESLVAALVILTTLLLQHHMLMPAQDLPLTLFLTLGLLAYHDYRQRGDTRDALLGGLWVALAMLTKGLVGPVLFALVAASDLALSAGRREIGYWRWHQVAFGVAVFVVIAAPWFVASAVRQGPEFVQIFILGRMGIGRAVQPMFTPVPYAWALFSYVPVLFLGVAPWTGVLPSALRRIWQDLRGATPLYRLCALWAAVPFIALSIAPTDRALRYLLPIFPPIAVFIARALVHTFHLGRDAPPHTRTQPITPAAISLLLGVGGAVMAVRVVASQNTAGTNIIPILQPAVLAVSAGLIAGGLAFASRRIRDAVTVLALGAVIGHAAFIIMAARHWDEIYPWKTVAAAIAQRHRPGDRVFVVGERDGERHFAHYYFPAPVLWIENDAALARRWTQGGAFALVAPDFSERVRAGLRATTIYSMPSGWILFTNR